MYNLSKHVSERIVKGQLPSDIILPVWITNDGLQSPVDRLSFFELFDLLKDLGKMAFILSNPQDTIQDDLIKSKIVDQRIRNS